ncbi:hypothetical protein HDV00_006168 [Rhizophlyctis rosea]|nr:hypothetical protein HDV00_006168 [Rhizophlyctis rosea]
MAGQKCAADIDAEILRDLELPVEEYKALPLSAQLDIVAASSSKRQRPAVGHFAGMELSKEDAIEEEMKADAEYHLQEDKYQGICGLFQDGARC